MVSAFVISIVTWLAGARIVRFFNDDSLADPLRHWLKRKYGDGSKPVQFATCPWCLSVWVYAALFPLAYYCGDQDWFLLPALVLGASWGYGIVKGLVDSPLPVRPVHAEVRLTDDRTGR
ncbi:hypothetical protein [Streptomyces alboflavus]|uniref:hypothetical protein n=1 Tax=Streptomyces alboflavus TaxID=67267 RepID=UPI0036AE931E